MHINERGQADTAERHFSLDKNYQFAEKYTEFVSNILFHRTDKHGMRAFIILTLDWSKREKQRSPWQHEAEQRMPICCKEESHEDYARHYCPCRDKSLMTAEMAGG